MDSLRDGKYIIGFLVGVICSFVIMSGIKNYNGVDDSNLSDSQNQSGGEVTDNDSNLGGGDSFTDNQQGSDASNTGIQTSTKPEDPNSPELQRLALILRETQRMVDRLQAELKATEEQQQVANLLSQSQ
ncbi:MAG: hypothetical protein U9P50_01335 [Patescibacteria group bacterium]|nr:hypothetical protein [Patescibacteria group bacterium]